MNGVRSRQRAFLFDLAPIEIPKPSVPYETKSHGKDEINTHFMVLFISKLCALLFMLILQQ